MGLTMWVAGGEVLIGSAVPLCIPTLHCRACGKVSDVVTDFIGRAYFVYTVNSLL